MRRFVFNTRRRTAGPAGPRGGFTLVEALVTTLVLSFIYGACLMILLTGSDSWQINSNRVELQQELRKGMDWMKEDLYDGIAASITGLPADGVWRTSITFRKAAGVSSGSLVWSTDSVTYAYDAADDEIERTEGAATRVVAQDITTFQVRRLSTEPEMIEVNVVGSKATLRGIPLVMTTIFKVHVRN